MRTHTYVRTHKPKHTEQGTRITSPNMNIVLHALQNTLTMSTCNRKAMQAYYTCTFENSLEAIGSLPLPLHQTLLIQFYWRFESPSELFTYQSPIVRRCY